MKKSNRVRKANGSKTDACIKTAMKQLLPASINKLFDKMQVAEEVIARKKCSCPKDKDKIHGAFKYLQPSQILNTVVDNKLYEKHCEEIIERVMAGADVNLGTYAEMAAALMHASLAAPLDGDHGFVYATIFKRLFGEQDFLKDDNYTFHESYAGRADEIISKLQKKLTTKRDCTT